MLTRNVSQYDLSEFVWNFGLLDFVELLPSNGKLVLRTGSIGIVCKTLWNGEVIPQEYVEK
jgi:hypothetical protein